MAPPPSVLPALPERFEGIARLGEGGQALTLAAHDRQRDRPVVIKVLELSAIADWKAFERFERECAVLQSLDHPGVPAYLEHARDEARGHYRLVMERIEGESLAHDLAHGRRRTEAQLLDLLEQLLDVLEYLHGLHPPVVHRDIKPSNVVVRPDGRAALVDFGGVAKVFQPKGSTTVVGTFGYMAPEQLHGRVTPGCDLYALGATLAALAAGEDAVDLPRKGLEVDLSEAIAAGPLRSVLAALLRADPDSRPASVAEVRARLGQIEAGDEPSVPPRPVPARVPPAPAPSSSLGRASVPAVWRRFSPRQRALAIGYLWAGIGLAVVTRAVILVLFVVVLFPVVMGVIHGVGRKD